MGNDSEALAADLDGGDVEVDEAEPLGVADQFGGHPSTTGRDLQDRQGRTDRRGTDGGTCRPVRRRSPVSGRRRRPIGSRSCRSSRHVPASPHRRRFQAMFSPGSSTPALPSQRGGRRPRRRPQGAARPGLGPVRAPRHCQRCSDDPVTRHGRSPRGSRRRHGPRTDGRRRCRPVVERTSRLARDSRTATSTPWSARAASSSADRLTRKAPRGSANVGTRSPCGLWYTNGTPRAIASKGTVENRETSTPARLIS